jgi:hypothetical protein
MTTQQAIRDFANGMVDNELDYHRQYRPEQFAKLTEADIEDYRKRKITEAEELATKIETRDPAIVARIDNGMLHPDNKFSRKLFSAITGITLPPTVSGTHEAIRNSDWNVLLAELRTRQQAEAEAKREAEAEAEAKQHAERMEKLVTNWKAATFITGDELIELIRFLNIDTHPRTLGTIRSRIVQAKFDQCRVVRGHVPEGVWEVIRTVQATLQDDNEPEPTPEDIATAQQLFGA